MVTPAIIVTRAEPGASETVARVQSLGLRPIASPMLVLAPLKASAPDLHDVSDLVFTSANGVHYFVDSVSDITPSLSDLTVWCVGPATTGAARAAGFAHVVAGDGNADQLADRILSSDVADRTFLHVANSAAAGTLVARLNAAGCDARFQALYETIPATRLSPDAGELIAGKDGGIILIHSAKAAHAFRALVKGATAPNIAFVAISAAAAAPVEALAAGRLRIADAPNEDALMQALQLACKDF